MWLEQAPAIHLQFTCNSPPNTFSEFNRSVQNYTAWIPLASDVSSLLICIHPMARVFDFGDQYHRELYRGEFYCGEESSIMEHSITENIVYTFRIRTPPISEILLYFTCKLENWAFMTMIQPSTMALSSLQLRSYLYLLVLGRGSNLEQVSISIYYLSPQCRGRWELGVVYWLEQ